jgi:hypothetical protein
MDQICFPQEEQLRAAFLQGEDAIVALLNRTLRVLGDRIRRLIGQARRINQRDLATARRVILLEILWHERYLTRPQLITRVEGVIGRGCFGTDDREDTFYRDMRLVKRALKAAGYQLSFSRRPQQPGYYLLGQPALSRELTEILEHSVAEVDPMQIRIFRQMIPAERFRLGCSISDTARQVVAYRIRLRNPELTQAEANILALQQGNPL